MRRVGLAVLAGWAFACAADDLSSVDRGRRVYVANCSACHHPDPALEGTLGPPIAGSSRELIEARVLRGEYPPGYTPLRDSELMQPLPYLQNDIEALAAYLNADPAG